MLYIGAVWANANAFFAPSEYVPTLQPSACPPSPRRERLIRWRSPLTSYTPVVVKCHQRVPMLSDKPICQQRFIFSLNFQWEFEEITKGLSAAAGSAASAWPRGPSRDIHIVVTRDLFARGNGPSRIQEACCFFIFNVCIRITTVVQVPVRKPQENHLTIRIIAVVSPLPKVFSNWRSRRNFSYHVDLPNTPPGIHLPEREHTQTLN